MTFNRRALLHAGLASTIGLMLQRSPRHAVAETLPEAAAAPAKSLIVLWMNGGASHLDTFDPKRDAQVAGPWSPRKTRAPAIEVSQHLPQVAEQAHHLAVIRSMTTKEGNHERARYLGHTGYAPNPTVAHPSLGAWVSAEKGERGTLPGFVSVGGPSVGGGFLGLEHGPFVMRDAGGAPDNLAAGFGVDRARLQRRLHGLAFLERRFHAANKDPSVASRQKIYARATRMMWGQEAAAFDLSEEPSALRSAYGDTPFGRGCLLARRLVSAGVRVVEVVQDGWDTHFDNFGRSERLLSELDPAMATLLRDLQERALLEHTLVLWLGDFGRSPRLNAREGRDHHPRAFSAVLAGGGVRGGVVRGATDARGESVVDKPTSIADLFATVAHQLGLAPDKSVSTPSGRPIMLTDHGVPLRDIIT